MSFLPSRPWATEGVKNLLPWLAVVLICVVSPIYKIVGYEEGWMIPKMSILAIASVLLWMQPAFNGRARNTSMDWPIVAFWLALAASTLVSIDKPTSLLGQYRGPFHGLLAMGLYTLIYYGVAAHDVSCEQIVNAVVVAGIYIGLVSLSQVGTAENGGRVWGTFGAPIFLGSFLALVLPLAWAKAREHKAMGIVCLGLSVCAIVAAKSRGAALAGFLGIIAYEVLDGNGWEMAMIGVLLSFGWPIILFWHPWRHAASDIGRYEIWLTAIKSWWHHPLFGSGPDTFALLYRHYSGAGVLRDGIGGDTLIQMSAHNDILQILSTMGLAGLTAYAWLTKRVFADIKDHSAIFAAIFSVCVVAKFNPVHLSVIAIGATMVAPLTRSV